MCKHTHKRVFKKARIVKRKATALTLHFGPLHFLMRNRRAVSAVISNLILIGAVMAIGLVALAYTRSTAINYQTQYSETMNTDIGKLRETLVFEYVHYESSSHKLYVYLLNSGTVKVEIDHASVQTSAVDYNLYPINDVSQSHPITNNTISNGQEVCLVSNLSSLNLPSGTYSIKLTSRSGTTFGYNFLV